MAIRTCTVLLLSSLLAGCSSTPDEDTEDPTYGNDLWSLKAPPNKTIELDEFEYEWSDLKRDNQGRKDSYEVARWATERHNAAMRCLRQEPPARIQATKILSDILERVPESSKDRYQLAVLRFREASYWFRAADAVAWHMDLIRTYRRTAMPGTPGDRDAKDLSDEEVALMLKNGRKVLDEANGLLKKAANESIRHFDRYRQARPDDKRILDFIWKLHFYLQNYERALQWLDYLLAEFDARGVPAQEPLRKDYSYIKTRLQDFLANLKIEGRRAAGTSVLPWNDKRNREMRRRISGN